MTGPLFDDIAMLPNGDDAWPRMVMLNDGEVEIRLRGGTNAPTPLSTSPNGPVSMIAADASSVAYIEANEPTTVHVQTIGGIEKHLAVEIDAKIDAPITNHPKLRPAKKYSLVDSCFSLITHQIIVNSTEK